MTSVESIGRRLRCSTSVPGYLGPYLKYPGHQGLRSELCKSASSGKPYLPQLVPLVALVREQRSAPAPAGDALFPCASRNFPAGRSDRHHAAALRAGKKGCLRELHQAPLLAS